MYSYEEFEKLVHAGQRTGELATVGALADWLNLKLLLMAPVFSRQ